MTPEQKQAWDLRASGLSRAQIAAKMDRSERAVKSLLERAKKWADADRALGAAAVAVGADTPGRIAWTKTHRDGTVTHSVMHTSEVSDEEFCDNLRDSLAAYAPLSRDLFAPSVNSGVKGDHLLVVDLADIHFGKLCTVSETGSDYNVNVARDRAVEGTRELLSDASGVGVSRILFVMGNDILHTENGKTTTSGTPQDTDGTYFTAWRAAQQASIDAISECAAMADTDLIHCMSNHDWRSGWALSQTIAAAMRDHGAVRATDYNLSERHRKYYGFERNGLMLSHGDGAKEEKLLGQFNTEARHLLNSWDHLYAILHHFHHKVRKRRGLDTSLIEKDHTGITAIMSGNGIEYGKGHLEIEYVRSPSSADGWHDRNAYTNRQGVECFMYHPIKGQKARFTAWF